MELRGLRVPGINIELMKTTTTPSDPNHEHYDWGASNSKQWIYCPGSVNFVNQKKAEGKIPERDESEFASEGTRAHDLADKCAKGEITRDEIPVNILADGLSDYLDLLEEVNESNGGVVFNEQKLPLFYAPDHPGTVDHSVVRTDLIEITDLKWGAGVWVEATENTQGAIYALSLVGHLENEGWEFDEDAVVRIRIFQPRHRNFDGVASLWELPLSELRDMGIDIQDNYEQSLGASVDDLNPQDGDNGCCRFCPARKGVCTKRIMNLFDEVPEDINPVTGDVTTTDEVKSELTDAAIVRIFQKHKDITKFMNDVMEDALALIEQGKTIEGLKTVDGKPGNRTWGDNEAEVEKLLKKLPAADRYKPRRVLSPAQAETALKKLDKPLKDQSTRFQNRFQELIVRKEGKPVLALETDERPARVVGSDRFDEEISAEDCI